MMTRNERLRARPAFFRNANFKCVISSVQTDSSNIINKIQYVISILNLRKIIRISSPMLCRDLERYLSRSVKTPKLPSKEFIRSQWWVEISHVPNISNLLVTRFPVIPCRYSAPLFLHPKEAHEGPGVGKSSTGHLRARPNELPGLGDFGLVPCRMTN